MLYILVLVDKTLQAFRLLTSSCLKSITFYRLQCIARYVRYVHLLNTPLDKKYIPNMSKVLTICV